jgi:hypothetical protein
MIIGIVVFGVLGLFILLVGLGELWTHRQIRRARNESLHPLRNCQRSQKRLHKRWLELLEETRKLQKKAGILDALERTYKEGTSPRSNDDEIRRLYFSVADGELRRALIRAKRDLYENLRESEQVKREGTRLALQCAAFNVECPRLPLVPAVCLGLVPVGLGYVAMGEIGAITGAVVGIFFGLATIQSARNFDKLSLKQAKAALDDLEPPVWQSMPDLFSESEAQSSQRDAQ